MKIDERIHNRTVTLIGKGSTVLSTHRLNSPGVIGFPTLDPQEYSNWRTQSLSFLTDLLGPDHVYTSNFRTTTERGGYTSVTRKGIGILQAVLEDIEQGFIETIRQLITAEVFSDLFDQAAHLLENGYRVPATSLAGALLENGLRSIANSKGVQVRTGDNLQSLNQKLAERGIYTRLTQKKVSVWTDIRNAADHGQFDQIEEQDTDELIKGAQSLLSDFL